MYYKNLKDIGKFISKHHYMFGGRPASEATNILEGSTKAIHDSGPRGLKFQARQVIPDYGELMTYIRVIEIKNGYDYQESTENI